MSQPEKVDVTIRINKSHAGRIDEVVLGLEALGLQSVARHERILIVNGAIASDQLAALRHVGGVSSVREDQIYRAQ